MAGSHFLIHEYRKIIPVYRQIEPIALKVIQDVVDENRFFLMTVQSRIKKESSFSEKIIRKADSIHSISDVTDLLGIRIICYFSDDLDRICKELLNHFIIDREHSVDKRKGLSVSEFGYMAIHGVFSLKQDGTIPEELLEHKFEIQIKTVLQHAWAEIEHDLGYKSEYGIPAEIRRRFSRAAGLMELGDQEFVSLRDSAREYTMNVHQRIAMDDVSGIPVNTVSLRKFMEINTRMLQLYERIRKECGIEIINVDCSRFIEKLSKRDILTLDELENRISMSENLIIEAILNQLGHLELDVAADSMILTKLLEIPQG